ncbi:MAG: PLP-dependent transferase [bacterium]
MPNIPCGQPIPNSTHAISLSLPTMRDVVGYEEKDLETIQKIYSGYPRFVTHPYVTRTQELFAQKMGISDKKILALCSPIAAQHLYDFIQFDGTLFTDDHITFVTVPFEQKYLASAQSFIQHTGIAISSRSAEEYLLNHGAIETKPEEMLFTNNPEHHIKQTLGKFYNNSSENNIFLYNTGMTSLYTAFSALHQTQKIQGKSEWIQLGWLYLDTMMLLQKIPSKLHTFTDVFNLENIEKLIENNHSKIAGIITEVTTNPLVQTPDITRLKTIAEQFNIPVIIDSSMATPCMVELLPHADIVIESLSKFASGNADLLMGAAILNEHSPHYNSTHTYCTQNNLFPFIGDTQRLAQHIGSYEKRMETINNNTLQLITYFSQHPTIKKVWWAKEEQTKTNFEKIAKYPEAVGGIITLEFHKPLKEIYDNLPLAKGPSFGTEFTLCMPYMYLAHYDLVSTKEGGQQLDQLGINPELVRLSVGLENPEEIIEAFNSVL